jgi:hypothetical protein
MGRVYTLLTCEGTWEVLFEQPCILNPPFYTLNVYVDEQADIVYQTWAWGNTDIVSIMRTIIGHLIANTDNYTGLAGLSDIWIVPVPDDGILSVYKPYFQVNANGKFESVGDIIWRLIQMTKCVIRLRKTNDLTIVFPQTTDATTKTFYSYQQPYFYEFKNIENITTPNYVVVQGKVDPEIGWDVASNYVIGTAASETTQVNKYFKVQQIDFEPGINNQSDCNTRAAVILNRLQNHDVTGEMTIPHDAALELYDFIEIVDTR